MSERYGREEDLRRREAGERQPLGSDIDIQGRRIDERGENEGRYGARETRISVAPAIAVVRRIRRRVCTGATQARTC